MKKVLSFIVILCLICTLFVGCGEGSESPTNAPVSQGESAVNKEVAVDENSAVFQQEAVFSKEEQQNNTASSKTSTSSASSKAPVSSAPSKISSKPVTSTPAVETDAPVADTNVEYPTFTGENSLKDWLMGKHPDYFADGRADTLNAMGNKGSVVYYKPSIAANHSLFALSQIEVHTPSGAMHYFYNDVETKDELLSFSVNHVASGADATRITDYMYTNMMAKYNGEPSDLVEDTKVYRYTYNKVDFYYNRYFTVGDHVDTMMICWRQFNTSHMATLKGHFDQIEEMIPLLYLQKVTVKGDTVTQ